MGSFTDGGAADGGNRAIAAIEMSGVEYRVVEYGEVTTVEEAANQRDIALTRLLKTMVVRLADGEFILILVPGDRSIDWGKLRRHLGVRRLAFASADEALTATGYVHGAITPLGAGEWPLIIDETVPGDGELSLGGGLRGVAIHIDAADLFAVVGGVRADVTKAAGVQRSRS